MRCSMPGFLVLHHLPEVAQIHLHWIGDTSNHLILYHPLLLFLSVFHCIRVFPKELINHIRWPKHWSFNFNISPSNELALHIRWQKYGSFSFIISPFNEYSGLISFRIDWFDLPAVQGTLKRLLQHHNLKASILQHSAIFMVQLSHLYMTTGKNKALTIGPLLAM